MECNNMILCDYVDDLTCESNHTESLGVTDGYYKFIFESFLCFVRW